MNAQLKRINNQNINDKRVGSLLIIVFFTMILLWVLATILNAKLLWFIFIWIASSILIYKNKKYINKKNIVTGFILGILSISSGLITISSTIIAFIAATSVFNKSNNKIIFMKSGKKNLILTSIIILITGVGLGAINVYGAINTIPINASFRFQWILDALRAGITEEILFRFLFFAICIELIKDIKLNKFESFICYLIMIVPHVLLHFNFSNFNISNIIAMSLIFGLPFTLLQMKRDLLTAIGSHALVDLIRFSLFGI